MRKLAFEERKAYNKRLQQDQDVIDLAVKNEISNSQLKKLKAALHNERQKYLADNKIVSIFGYVYTELETPIEGTVHEKN